MDYQCISNSDNDHFYNFNNKWIDISQPIFHRTKYIAYTYTHVVLGFNNQWRTSTLKNPELMNSIDNWLKNESFDKYII